MSVMEIGDSMRMIVDTSDHCSHSYTIAPAILNVERTSAVEEKLMRH
jgi:hypothetical protein